MKRLTYKRILLKISGEAFLGEESYGISTTLLSNISAEIKEIHSLGLQIGIVLGGGNIFRGVAASIKGMDRVTADHIGMLATIMNSLALQQELEGQGVSTRVLSAIEMKEIADLYVRHKAIDDLENGRIVVLAGGTGNPYFTTDTAASLRAIEIGAEVILKGTKVDGVYDRDPMTDSQAIKMDEVTYTEVLKRNLKVMDATAISLSRENRLPIIVFNLLKPGSIKGVVLGEKIGTIIKE